MGEICFLCGGEEDVTQMDLARWGGRIVLMRRMGEGRVYTVGEHFSYLSRAGKRYQVLDGFRTDGASVPRIAWAYMSPFAGVHVPAVILHDALYATHFGDRKFCDGILREALESLGVRSSKAWMVYRSVRMGGSGAWRGHEPPFQLGEVLRAG